MSRLFALAFLLVPLAVAQTLEGVVVRAVSGVGIPAVQAPALDLAPEGAAQ